MPDPYFCVEADLGTGKSLIFKTQAAAGLELINFKQMSIL